MPEPRKTERTVNDLPFSAFFYSHPNNTQSMNTLKISQLGLITPSLASVSQALSDRGTLASINIVNWADYPYQPRVTFAMAYDEAALYLKFFVEEKHIRAVETQPNGSVWEDSCCEFFCSFDDKGYYNMETNCIGTQLLGWGTKENRERATPSLINTIQKHSTLGDQPMKSQSGQFEYQLTMIVPASAFYDHQMKFKAGDNFRANFYKCGDKTAQPHFLSWNPITAPQPDFHRPDCFGMVELG